MAGGLLSSLGRADFFFEQRQADEGTRVPSGPGLDPPDRDPSGRGCVARV